MDAHASKGAGTLAIIFSVLVPIARPTLAAFSLFGVAYHWNDSFWPLVTTTSETVRALPIGVAMLREEGTGDRWHIAMAGSTFVGAPVLAVFIVARRPIIRAFTFMSLRSPPGHVAARCRRPAPGTLTPRVTFARNKAVLG